MDPLNSNFVSKSQYDSVQKYRCPLATGFWHYSPNDCCLFIDEKTNHIFHLYFRESCSLTRHGQTIPALLASRQMMVDNDIDDHDYCNTTKVPHDNRFLNVLTQPYLNSTAVIQPIEQCMLNNMNDNSKNILLSRYDETLQQYWFIVCDTKIKFDNVVPRTNVAIEQRVIKNLFGPLLFCSDPDTLVSFFGNITKRFILEQMPILNSVSPEILMKQLKMNIEFIGRNPAVKMIKCQPYNNLYYMDARDLFDVVMTGRSGCITNMRLVHLSKEANFLDTWRRILFNFLRELVNIQDSYEKPQIRIRGNCSVLHFLKGNNKTVIPEFRCEYERNKCIHLLTRRKEYELFQTHNCNRTKLFGKTPIDDKYSIALSDDGVLCRHVLDVMVDEYGETAVNEELNFNCYFDNTLCQQENVALWERVIYNTLDLNRSVSIKEGSSISRERIACMQTLCKEKRMNDIHRFCLPKRFLTLSWFKWACESLKLNVFEED